MTADLRRLSRKADSRNSESVTRSPLRLVSVHQEPVHIKLFKKELQQVSKKPIVNEKRLLPKLWRKRAGVSLSGPKSSFQSKVNFAFHLEIKVIETGGRMERHRIQGVCDDLRCHVICWCSPLCFIKSKVNTAVYQISEHFMLPSADKLYGDTDLALQQDLASDHWAKTTTNWFSDNDINMPDWPANLSDRTTLPRFSICYCREEDKKHPPKI